MDPDTNQIGVNPNLTPLENNGGPTPSRRTDPADGPTQDQGDDSVGLRFDQRGFFRTVGGGTDVGAVESGNRVFLAASGDWSDPANWLAGIVPGEGDPAWIGGGATADLTGSGPINVDSINVGVSGDVGSVEGNVIGSDVTITANTIDVGSAYGAQSPINSGNGTLTLTDSNILTTNISAGVSESTGEGVYTTAHGSISMTSDGGGTSTLDVAGNAGAGAAAALAPGAKAHAQGALEFDGQSASFGALSAGEAFSLDGGRATTTSQVTITADDNVTAGSLSTGTAFAGDNSSSSVLDARVDITANDVFMVDGPANIGNAQVSGAAAEPASADVENVWYSMTADQHTVNSGLRVGQVGASSFGTPGGGDLPTAHVGTVRADINVQTLDVANNLEVASLFATGPSENSSDDVSLTITGSDTEVSGVVAVGTMFLSDGATGGIGSASLDVEGGSFNVTNTPTFLPSLRVGTVDKFSAGPELAQLLAAARFHGVEVDLASGVVVGGTNVAGADPASSIQATLELVDSQMTVGGDVAVAEQGGVATIASTLAIVRLNYSLLAIAGDLRMGEGAMLDFTVEGLTRPALGMPGAYGAIDATNATLDGQLVLDFDFPGAQLGDMFELVRLDPAGMFTGFFDDTTVTGLPAGLSAEAAIVGTSLIATIIAAARLPGDYNNDGSVDAADYVVWRKNPSAFGGDPAGYNTWRANFGRSAGSGSDYLSGAAVPEPASGVLLLLTVPGLFLRRPKITFPILKTRSRLKTRKESTVFPPRPAVNRLVTR